MKTVFIRAIEAPVDEKASAILAAVRGPSPARFEVDALSFSQLPRSPFAYWASDALRAAFRMHPPFESGGRAARVGMGTLDDFRFLRAFWELESAQRDVRWMPYVGPGRFARFYAPIHLAVHYERDGYELKTFVEAKVGSASRKIQAQEYYFRPGVSWPLRGAVFSAKAVPSGCIFSVAGKMAFADDGELLEVLAIFNSSVFNRLVVLFAGKVWGVQYESGLIGRVPFPRLEKVARHHLRSLSQRGWSFQYFRDASAETSHAYVLPGILRSEGVTLVERAAKWARATSDAANQLENVAAKIDDLCLELYGLQAEDLVKTTPDASDEDDVQETEDGDTRGVEVEEEDCGIEGVDPTPMTVSLLSWSLGVALGRFDVRLATGFRPLPPEPEPFDPLPVCPPGMLRGDDGLPLAAPPAEYPLTFPTDGILVDDPGHPRDLVRAVRSVFEAVFDDANARWHEAAELLGAPDLRTWFARDFFEPHIKRYSKSRRKAPIYWQLATASGSYSVWIYLHRATGDTLFRVLNDFVGPKLDHEKAKLDGLTQEAGGNPSAAQRRELEQQETFVGELQALKTEVARVAPLWKPNLDDGVILNFAPLWRLVPQSRSWQGECKKAWDKLQSGDYDWAHLAMHLWPERVVAKCVDDRSLAIAHGLEDVFWHEDESGKWSRSRLDDAEVQMLITDRTSSTVGAALKDLLSAPTPSAGKGRKPKSRSTAPRKATPRLAASAPRPSTPDTTIDETTLDAVKEAIASVADGASKADVLVATGLSDADWNKTIAVLLDRGDVSRTGQKRGTRYHAGSQGEDG